MIRKLDWYVLKEMLIPLIAGTIVVGLLFVSNELIAIFKNLDLKGVPPEAIMKFAILSFPKWYLLVFPMGVTFGSSLAISRLAREGEITAMRAAGISFWRILRTVAVVGLVFAGLSYYNSDKVTPWASREYNKLIREFGVVGVVGNIQQNQTISLPPYSANFGQVITEGQTLILKDVLLFERPKPGQVYIYTAPTGRYSAGVWKIDNPEIRIIEGESLIMVNRVKELTINQRIVLNDFVPGQSEKERSNKQLWDDIVALRKAKVKSRLSEVEFYSRFAGAATCVGFALMGGILAFRFRRGSAFQGFLISLGTVWMYFNAQIIMTQAIGRNSGLDPVLAAWSPFFVVVFVTLVALWRIE